MYCAVEMDDMRVLMMDESSMWMDDGWMELIKQWL